MDDWSKTSEWRRYARHVQKEVVPKIADHVIEGDMDTETGRKALAEKFRLAMNQ